MEIKSSIFVPFSIPYAQIGDNKQIQPSHLLQRKHRGRRHQRLELANINASIMA